MADLIVKASQLNVLATALAEMAPLTPPPTPKGRYVLAKAIPLATKAAEAHGVALKAFLDGAVTQDEDGKPIYKVNGNQMTFDVKAEHQAAYVEIQNEDVTLAGVRQLTRAELGDCPITVQQEMVLIACGLLQDEEPV